MRDREILTHRDQKPQNREVSMTVLYVITAVLALSLLLYLLAALLKPEWF